MLETKRKEDEDIYPTHKHRTSIANINNIIASEIIPKHQLNANVNEGTLDNRNRNSYICRVNKNILGKNTLDLFPIRGNIRSNKRYGTGKYKMDYDYANTFKNICFKFAAKKTTLKKIVKDNNVNVSVNSFDDSSFSEKI